MRLVALGLALALAAPAPLVAQTHVATPPLARGEVLLEVNAIGMVSTRADRATLSFSIRGTGATEHLARVEAEQKIREIRPHLRGQGVAESDIRIEPVNISPGDPADQAMADAIATMNAAAADAQRAAGRSGRANATPPAAPAEPPSFSASAAAEIVIRDVSSVPAILATLDQHHINVLMGANYALDDDSAPRRQARQQAVEKARASAEAYAAALNMRVVRVVRVTERLGFDLMALAASDRSLNSIIGFTGARNNGPDVPTVAVIGVDFALAPR